MTVMAFTLTCPCGHKQSVANPTSGRSVSCGACGKTLTIPAMGVLAPKPKPREKAMVPARATLPVGLLLSAVGVFLILVAGAGWLLWSMTRGQPVEPQPIAQQQTPDAPRPVMPSPPRQPGNVEKKATPNVIDAVRPPEKSAPAEPIELPPPVVIQPVAQVGKLPNPFLLPIEVAKDPPKVAEKKPNVLEPLKLVWKLQADDVFYQELVVTQKPMFKVQGLPIASLLQYRIVSRFTVKKIDDGALVVEQKIESARLLQADDLTKPIVEGAVKKMPGTTYTLHLSPKMDVTKFEGAAAGFNFGALDLAGGMGFQMASLLDRDGWKELAQATFFQFDQPLKLKDRWSKPMTHNWGSLGSWAGQIHYRYDGKQDKLHRVAYGLQLAYKSPAAGAVGLLKVNAANFQTQQAEGVLLFDAARGRVIGAEERFRVKGFLNANLLGQATQVEIEEDQHFLIRIHDKMPQ